jgi:EAL domain-containing protein (putative c-di-GMP-specific phosphodiesterase class I)
VPVVAEGIEELEQATRLREMGCDIGQGYHFARPMAPDDILTRYGPAGD